MRKGEIKYKILNLIEDSVIESVKFPMIVISAGYGASLGRLWRVGDKINSKIDNYRIDRKKMQESKIRVQKYLWKLKKDGLIRESKSKIILTEKGRNKLLADKYKFLIPEIKKTNSLIIISYDIPEYLNTERKRLIEMLKILKFKPIHQSLWSGNTLVTKEILETFEKRGTLKHLHIFEVSKQGTLQKLN